MNKLERLIGHLTAKDLRDRLQQQTDEIYTRHTGSKDGMFWNLGIHGVSELFTSSLRFLAGINYRVFGAELAVKGSKRIYSSLRENLK